MDLSSFFSSHEPLLSTRWGFNSLTQLFSRFPLTFTHGLSVVLLVPDGKRSSVYSQVLLPASENIGYNDSPLPSSPDSVPVTYFVPLQ